jgi:hypothetical protein
VPFLLPLVPTALGFGAKWIISFLVGQLRQRLSYAQISDVLNAEGIPTPAGRPLWRKEYVDRLLHTKYARDIMESEARDRPLGSAQ